MGLKLGLSQKRREEETEVCQDRVLEKTFQPKKTVVTAGCRKLHSDQVHDLYCSPYTCIRLGIRPPLWSSGQSFWLQIQRSRVRFPALADFLSSSGSGTGSTQPREVN